MPRNAPETKVAGVAHWGATVRLHGETYDEAKAFAKELAEQNGFRLLSAFDDVDVIAGQGTVGLEIASVLMPDVVIVPIGGGGLGDFAIRHGYQRFDTGVTVAVVVVLLVMVQLLQSAGDRLARRLAHR